MLYDHAALQAKYRRIWKEHRIYEPDLLAAARPYYNLMMFPYPSAEGLHVGNMYAFTGADVHGRFRRMQGYDVFQPIGLDGFGIHSENYALKIGKHPAEQAKISEARFYDQLDAIGDGFAWDERLETYDPDYYRWTQWLFAEMFRRGLAYRALAMVNWCPSCKTVLSDEQVEDGRCERCKNLVERREMASWFLRITHYADRLLDNLTDYAWTDVHGERHVGLKWPAKVVTAQRNWIGRSSGLEIDFGKLPPGVRAGEELPLASLPQEGSSLTVWTKFWETIFGVTYLVIAPEHPLVDQITTEDQRAAVAAYVAAARNKSEQDRLADRDKSGVFTGAFVVNPANNERVPVWVADYVLAGVGTGVVMGVPAHDARDFAFAQKYDLPIRQVVAYANADINAAVARGERSYEGEGTLTASGAFSGQDAWGEGKAAIRDWLVQQGWARETTTYHLRDWLISRQRYWGAPLPLVHCAACASAGRGEQPDAPGWYAVPNEELPVLLPPIDDYKPKGDGSAPLDNAPDEWKFTKCPSCGERAVRETNVADTFLDSSWYFLRYPWVSRDDVAFPGSFSAPAGQALQAAGGRRPDPQRLPWFPVDAYIGGAEHAVLHLLYARFVTMALYDWGMVPQEEPFPFLFGHGLIIKDGAKMSKSRGNVVNPDEYIAKYGADALRAYLMFLGPYEQGGDFRDTGMHGMAKWLTKIWQLAATVKPDDASSPALQQKLHQVIAVNTREMAQFRFNTCLARLMEFVNMWKGEGTIARRDFLTFVLLLAPFAPYVAEELYQLYSDQAQGFRSVHSQAWPQHDAAQAQSETAIVVVQVNGKRRAQVELPQADAQNQALVQKASLALADVQRHVSNRDVRKVIFVPGKIINLIV